MPKLTLDWGTLQTAWDDIRSSGHFTEGKYTRLLEEEAEKWSGLYAVAVSNGGSGLFALLRAAQTVFCFNDNFAVSNNTFFATGAMAKEAGHTVILTDCNREDFGMSFADLRTKTMPIGGVIVTHVGGGLARDMSQIEGWASHRGALVFEDAAHALGVGEAGSTAGTYTDGAVFSFYPTKAIPAGEGGLVLTRHRGLAQAVREFRNYGKYLENGVVKYRGEGFNLRMDEWTAAVAWMQLCRRHQIIEAREKAVAALRRLFDPIVDWDRGESNWYKFIVDARQARDLGVKRFAGQVYAYSDQLKTAMGMPGAYPNCTWVADNHLCLPVDEYSYEGWDDGQIIAWLRGEG